jgi:hypothetical protein
LREKGGGELRGRKIGVEKGRGEEGFTVLISRKGQSWDFVIITISNITDVYSGADCTSPFYQFL